MRVAMFVASALILCASTFSQGRLIGVHADNSGPPPCCGNAIIRIPDGLSVVTGVTAGTPSFSFAYGSGTGTWAHSNLPAGQYMMWHSAAGFDPAEPWASWLANPVTFDPSLGDMWASAALTSNPNVPRMTFQQAGTQGLVPLGSTLDLDFGGQPFAQVFVLLSTGVFLPPPHFPGIGHLFAFSLSSGFISIPWVFLDPNGHAATTTMIPSDGTLRGLVLFAQAIEFDITHLLLSNLLAIQFT